MNLAIWIIAWLCLGWLIHRPYPRFCRRCGSKMLKYPRGFDWYSMVWICYYGHSEDA
jgi:hypothetical protein